MVLAGLSVSKKPFPVSEKKADIIKALREWIYSVVMIDLDENAEGEKGEKTRADRELCLAASARFFGFPIILPTPGKR